MEGVETLEYILMTPNMEWSDGTSEEAAVKAIKDNYEVLEEFDSIYYFCLSFEADLGKIELRSSI